MITFQKLFLGRAISAAVAPPFAPFTMTRDLLIEGSTAVRLRNSINGCCATDSPMEMKTILPLELGLPLVSRG